MFFHKSNTRIKKKITRFLSKIIANNTDNAGFDSIIEKTNSILWV